MRKMAGDENTSAAASQPQSDGDKDTNVEIEDLSYAFESFRAVAIPVSITMMLSALSVNWITTQEWSEAREEALHDSYTVVKTDESTSTSAMLGSSLINGLVIIAAIAAMTFMVVLLLKFRCIKVLYGYLLLAFFMILFFTASEYFRVAIEAYDLHRVDKVSFWCSLFNFATVGTLAIFLPQGLPIWSSQMYLIFASVLVAWTLSQFDEWTAWMLLILLSLYDLFAVLTPCGPLKALINVLQKDDAPSMPPGILFEARLRNPQAPKNSNNINTRQSATTKRTARSSSYRKLDDAQSRPPSNRPVTVGAEIDTPKKRTELDSLLPSSNERKDVENWSGMADGDEESKVEMGEPNDRYCMEGQEITIQESMLRRTSEDAECEEETHKQPNDDSDPVMQQARESETFRDNGQTPQNRTDSNLDGIPVRVPLALARAYRLRLVDDPNPIWRRRKRTQDQEVPSTSPEKGQFTVSQLVSCVDALVPQNGGRIEPHPKQHPGSEIRYKVTDRHGKLRRIVFVGKENGEIYQDMQHGEEESSKGRNRERAHSDRIRLGLGDFVFYSVLVAVASQDSFVAFAACFNVILSGLLVTLLVLAVFKKPLPALPISVLAAVIAYILVRVLIQGWVEEIFIQGIYV